MKFAIIAGGEGSRLKQEGVTKDKPLVEIGGESMLHRLVRIFTNEGAEEIVIAANSKMPKVIEAICVLIEYHRTNHLCPIVCHEVDTPSSMHSFYAISRALANNPFCLTTIDTVFNEKEFHAYLEEFKQQKSDGLMAVTSYIDDEKPLYVSTNKEMSINGFLDESKDCKYISGGIYALTEKVIPILNKCVAEGKMKMRNFQRELIQQGILLKAYPFSQIIDVDHASDIAKAEKQILQQSI